ncbi:MAG: hypothetical protein K6G52_08105 [Treponemataceae bacterium]|nr:hypothetical protein [Treponemataceae bacterium]
MICLFSLFASDAKTSQSKGILLQGKYKYENEANLFALKLQDNLFSSVVHTEIYPESGLKNWGTRFYDGNLYLNLGSLSFSGLKSRMNNPNWQGIDALKTIKVDSLKARSQNPATWSSSTPFSAFASYTLPLENTVSFKPAFSFVWTPSFIKTEDEKTDEEIFTDSSLYFASLLFPFRFKAKKSGSIRLDFTLNYGTNYLENNEKSWYLDEPFFQSERQHLFMETLYFYSRYFSFQTLFGQNSSPQGSVKLYNRTDALLTVDFSRDAHFSTEARLLLCQNDLHSLSGKTLRVPLHYCILPEFTFDLKNSSLSFSFLFDAQYKYSGGKEAQSLNSNLYQGAVELDFLYWNLSTKYTHSDVNEVYLGFWVQALKNKTARLNLNGSLKFQNEIWSATFLARCTFFSKQDSFLLTASFSLQDDYQFQTLSWQGKLSFSCFGFTGGCTIKKAAFKSDSADSNTAFDFYLGYCAKF